jgi:hypothetical protein
VAHHGHAVNAYRLLWRRVRTGYAFGIGDVLRAALGRPHLRLVLAGLKEIYLWLAMIGWWLTLAVLVAVDAPFPLKLVLLAAVLAAPVLVMAVRARSFRRGLYAVTAWNAYTVGLMAGLLRRRRPPAAPIASRILHDIATPGTRAA